MVSLLFNPSQLCAAHGSDLCRRLPSSTTACSHPPRITTVFVLTIFVLCIVSRYGPKRSRGVPVPDRVRAACQGDCSGGSDIVRHVREGPSFDIGDGYCGDGSPWSPLLSMSVVCYSPLLTRRGVEQAGSSSGS
jgi:hypothetical protein